jgi:hypothetical protein
MLGRGSKRCNFDVDGRNIGKMKSEDVLEEERESNDDGT